jgi:hypothetical protein
MGAASRDEHKDHRIRSGRLSLTPAMPFQHQGRMPSVVAPRPQVATILSDEDHSQRPATTVRSGHFKDGLTSPNSSEVATLNRMTSCMINR